MDDLDPEERRLLILRHRNLELRPGDRRQARLRTIQMEVEAHSDLFECINDTIARVERGILDLNDLRDLLGNVRQELNLPIARGADAPVANENENIPPEDENDPVLNQENANVPPNQVPQSPEIRRRRNRIRNARGPPLPQRHDPANMYEIDWNEMIRELRQSVQLILTRQPPAAPEQQPEAARGMPAAAAVRQQVPENWQILEEQDHENIREIRNFILNRNVELIEEMVRMRLQIRKELLDNATEEYMEELRERERELGIDPFPLPPW